jgi:hypothetical protein
VLNGKGDTLKPDLHKADSVKVKAIMPNGKTPVSATPSEGLPKK